MIEARQSSIHLQIMPDFMSDEAGSNLSIHPDLVDSTFPPTCPDTDRLFGENINKTVVIAYYCSIIDRGCLCLVGPGINLAGTAGRFCG